MRNAKGERLFAKVGGGVDYDVGVFVGEVEAAAASGVFWVGGGADGAFAADAGNAVRASGSEQGVMKGAHVGRSFPAFFNMNHFMGRPSHAVKMPRPTKNMQINPMVRAAKKRRPRLRSPKPFIKQAASEERSMPPVKIRLRVLSYMKWPMV